MSSLTRRTSVAVLRKNDQYNVASINSIQGYTCHLDASSRLYLRLSGTAITGFLDRSGNGNHSDVQSTGTKRPAFATNQLNGLPTATFDNGDTIIFTAKPSLFSITNNGNTVFIVAKRNTEAAVVDQIYTMTEGGSGRNYIKFSATSGQINYISRSADANLATVTGAVNTNYQILTGRRSGTEQAISFNGGTAATNANGLDETGVDAMYIGSRADTDSFLDGGLAELIIYNRALASSEARIVEVYLANKWGIYHPNASWILAYNSAKRSFIHANKLNKSDADAAFAIVYAWYKTDSEFLTIPTGTEISQFLDISGNGRHTDVQATSASRPAFNSTGINSRGLSVFSSDFLMLPSSMYTLANGDNGVFCVANRTSAGAVIRSIFSATQGGSTRYRLCYTTTTDLVEFQSADALITGVQATATETNFNIFTTYKSGTTQSIQVNNGVAVTDANGVNEPDINSMAIGSNGIGTTNFLMGGMAELIFCNSAPSAQHIIWFNTYLGSQFNITIS